MLKVVICGSYHRDSEGLERIFRELEANGCRILSPISIKFKNTEDEVVKNSKEEDFTVSELESFHLRAIRDADFIWLHDPLGYVGISGSYEIGYASALGIPVFCKEILNDEMLQTRVKLANSVFDALENISNNL
jgi:hypothetical protein